jgi:hypothetical protein
LVIPASDPAIEGLFPGRQRRLDQLLPERGILYDDKSPALIVVPCRRPVVGVDDVSIASLGTGLAL